MLSWVGCRFKRSVVIMTLPPFLNATLCSWSYTLRAEESWRCGRWNRVLGWELSMWANTAGMTNSFHSWVRGQGSVLTVVWQQDFWQRGFQSISLNERLRFQVIVCWPSSDGGQLCDQSGLAVAHPKGLSVGSCCKNSEDHEHPLPSGPQVAILIKATYLHLTPLNYLEVWRGHSRWHAWQLTSLHATIHSNVWFQRQEEWKSQRHAPIKETEHVTEE